MVGVLGKCTNTEVSQCSQVKVADGRRARWGVNMNERTRGGTAVNDGWTAIKPRDAPTARRIAGYGRTALRGAWGRRSGLDVGCPGNDGRKGVGTKDRDGRWRTRRGRKRRSGTSGSLFLGCRWEVRKEGKLWDLVDGRVINSLGSHQG